VTGSLPDATSYLPDGSWVDGNGVPKKLTFGWTGATGAATDYHLVTDVNAIALSATPPPAPALGLTLSDDSSVSVHNGDTVNVHGEAPR